jgi:hypothetical protein
MQSKKKMQHNEVYRQVSNSTNSSAINKNFSNNNSEPTSQQQHLATKSSLESSSSTNSDSNKTAGSYHLTGVSGIQSHSSGYHSNGSYSNYSTNGKNNNKNFNVSSSSGIYASGSNYDMPVNDDHQNENISKTVSINKPSMVNNEILAKEVLEKCGPSFTYQRIDYSHDIGSFTNNNTTSKFQDKPEPKKASEIINQKTTNNSEISNTCISSSNKNNSEIKSECDQTCNINIIKIDPPPLLYSESSVTQIFF